MGHCPYGRMPKASAVVYLLSCFPGLGCEEITAAQSIPCASLNISPFPYTLGRTAFHAKAKCVLGRVEPAGYNSPSNIAFTHTIAEVFACVILL